LLVRIDGDSIVFEADLCLAPDVDVCGDEVVPGTLTRVALPHMRVEMTYQEYVGDGYEWIDYVQQTDAEGRIAIPAGGQPMVGDVYGLRSDDIVVEQEFTYAGSTFRLSPVASLDFRFGPPYALPVDHDAPLEEAFIHSSHLNAFYHVQRAFESLEVLTGPAPTGPLTVRFVLSDDFFLARHLPAERRIELANALTPHHVPVASSGSILAHETAHHFLTRLQFPNQPFCFPPWDRLGEGLSDYLATVVAGHPVIGGGFDDGETPFPRILSNNFLYRYADVQACAISDDHQRGLVIGGSLHDARESYRFALPGGDLLFDGMVRDMLVGLRAARDEAISTGILPDEVTILGLLLAADDDDGDLLNGTPRMRILYDEFSRDHGIPWPLDFVPTSHGLPFTLGVARAPGTLEVQVTDAVPGSALVVFGSLDPVGPWVVGDLDAYLDPATLTVLARLGGGSSGTAQATIHIPLGAYGLDVAMTAVMFSGSLSISNGLRLRL
jgi:hypothetical protein